MNYAYQSKTKFILVKRKILEVIHWSVLIFLVLSSLIFVIEVAPMQNADQVIIKDNRLMFCTNDHCVNYAEKTYWTFLEMFVVEIIVGGLALVAIREEISIERRVEDHKL